MKVLLAKLSSQNKMRSDDQNNIDLNIHNENKVNLNQVSGSLQSKSNQQNLKLNTNKSNTVTAKGLPRLAPKASHAELLALTVSNTNSGLTDRRMSSEQSEITSPALNSKPI